MPIPSSVPTTSSISNPNRDSETQFPPHTNASEHGTTSNVKIVPGRMRVAGSAVGARMKKSPTKNSEQAERKKAHKDMNRLSEENFEEYLKSGSDKLSESFFICSHSMQKKETGLLRNGLKKTPRHNEWVREADSRPNFAASAEVDALKKERGLC